MFKKRKLKKLLNQLNNSYNNHDYDLALHYCDMVLNIESNNPYALFIKARVLVIQGDVSEAMSYYKKALETGFFDMSNWVDEVSYYMDGDIYSKNYKLSDRNEIVLELCDL